MIAKTTRGASATELVRRLFGPGDAGQHTGQRVVGSGDNVVVTLGEPLPRREVLFLGRQLDATKVLFGTMVTGGHIWHLSLTNDAGDRALTDDEWGAVTCAVVDRTGFDSGLDAPACPWVAVRHGLTRDGRDHVHVVVSLVRTDGTTASVWKDWWKVSAVCGEAERSLGLRVLRHAQSRLA